MSGLAHTGWNDSERELLIDETMLAAKEGRPIKSVFLKVSEITGRKPNSIRNYYYLKLKDEETIAEHIHTFTPFSDGELRELMRAVLRGRARGRSVRSVVCELSGGDKKLMLRLQNKYRSTVSTKPQLVAEILSELKGEGIEGFDPYEAHGLKQQTELARSLRAAGVSERELLDAIGTFSKIFNQQRDMRECAEMMEKYESEYAQNRRTAEKIEELKALNRSFLDCEPKAAGLKEYIAAVEECIK